MGHSGCCPEISFPNSYQGSTVSWAFWSVGNNENSTIASNPVSPDTSAGLAQSHSDLSSHFCGLKDKSLTSLRVAPSAKLGEMCEDRGA